MNEPGPSIDPIEITPLPDPWTGVATASGLGLAAIAALSVLGILTQGFAVEQKTGLLYKLGIAFLRNLDATPAGLMAVIAVVLIAAPSLTRRPAVGRQDLQARVALGLVVATCLVVVFGTILGVITRLHFDQGPGQQITSATRRVLATFAVRSMGPALVALGGALAIRPLRSPRRVTPAPYADVDDGLDAGPEPGPGTDAP
jgi:hypothetical protein